MLHSTDQSHSNLRKSAHSKNKRNRRRWLLWLVVILVIVSGAWLVYKSQQDVQKNSYLTEPVKRGDIENSIAAVGTLNALRSINVGAQVSGQLQSVKVEVGDSITHNQLLAEIDPSPFEKKVEISSAQLDNLKAQLLSKEAQLKLKKLNSDRQKSLLASRTATQAAIDLAEAELSIANAEVQALKAQIRQQKSQLASAQVDLGYTHIYSPMDGTVVHQTSKEGETLNAVQSAPTVVTVADLQVMTVEAKVSEADISYLKPGMPVYFTLLGQQDKRFTGKLRQIKPTPETENNVVLYKALFDVPNPKGELMIHMSAQVFFVIDEATDTLLVPNAAINYKKTDKDLPQAFVKIVAPSGEITEQPVETGVRNRVQTEIKSGLKAGDNVIVTSATENSTADVNRRRRARF